MTRFPPFINLGVIGRDRSGSKKILGQEARSPDDLPGVILGCALRRESFMCVAEPFWKALLGKRVRSWSATWQGREPGTAVEVSWASEIGWNLAYTWRGKEAFCAGGFRDLSLDEFFSKAAAQGFLGCVERCAPRMPVAVLRTPAKAPKMASFPDGAIVSLTLPVHAEHLSAAVRAFQKLEDLALTCPVSGRLILRPVVKIVKSAEPAAFLYEKTFKDTGVPCPDLPQTLEGGRTAVFMLQYELRIGTAFYQMPAICERLESLMVAEPHGWQGACQASATRDLADELAVPIPEGTFQWQPLSEHFLRIVEDSLIEPRPSEARLSQQLDMASQACRVAKQTWSAMFGESSADDVKTGEEGSQSPEEDDEAPQPEGVPAQDADGVEEREADSEEEPGDARQPFGVPLESVAMPFLMTEGCAARFEGSTLYVKANEQAPVETRVEVVKPPQGAFPDIAALVRVTTPMAIPKAEEFEDEAIAHFNMFAAGGALYRDAAGNVLVGARITYFTENNSWQDVQMPLIASAAVQNIQPIAGVLAGMDLEGESDWHKADFQQIASILERYGFFANADEKGLSAEVPLEGRGITMADGTLTALVQYERSRHPVLGGGLLCRLSLPNAFESGSACCKAACWLNRLEMESAVVPYHYGAWCTRDGRTLCYVTFFRNELKGSGALAINWGFNLTARAKWAWNELKDFEPEN